MTLETERRAAFQHRGISDPVTLLLKIKDLANQPSGIDNLKTLVGISAESREKGNARTVVILLCGTKTLR